MSSKRYWDSYDEFGERKSILDPDAYQGALPEPADLRDKLLADRAAMYDALDAEDVERDRNPVDPREQRRLGNLWMGEKCLEVLKPCLSAATMAILQELLVAQYGTRDQKPEVHHA